MGEKLTTWQKTQSTWVSYHSGEGSQRFFISRQRYDRFFREQGGVCAICKQPETRRHKVTRTLCRLCIDHDHKTGVVRGLLCHRCNVAVGMFRDSPENLQSTIEYLQKPVPTIIAQLDLFDRYETLAS